LFFFLVQQSKNNDGHLIQEFHGNDGDLVHGNDGDLVHGNED
jgi:hypothetical protein